MADSDYWKKRYNGTWDISSKREESMKQFLEKRFNVKVLESGLGAGSTDYITGTAANNGFNKGDADLHIENTSVFIEVTGPLSTKVPSSAPLWFRPDKIQNAISNIATHKTILAHNCPGENLWRYIYIDSTFVNNYNNGKYKIVHPNIRGVTETYIEIPVNDISILTQEQFNNLLPTLI